MKILIIENEKPAAIKLQYLLEKIDKNISIVGITETVEESINWLQSMPTPDLILIDIQLDDGISFEIFDTIKVNIPVIFTTAYNEFVLQAFKLNSVDYLLKPIEENALCNAINKFKTVHYNFNGEVLRQLSQSLNKQYKTRFLIKIGSRFKSIPIAEIYCFYFIERSLFVKTFDAKTYDIDYSLDQIQKIINPDNYFRINRNFIVCIDAITDMVSYSSSRLQLRLDQKMHPISENLLVVSREKVNKFKKWIDR